MSGRLDGMVAVITGAASGIGAGTARRLSLIHISAPARLGMSACAVLCL